jgi:hypothetical protein
MARGEIEDPNPLRQRECSPGEVLHETFGQAAGLRFKGAFHPGRLGLKQRLFPMVFSPGLFLLVPEDGQRFVTKGLFHFSTLIS